MYQVVLLDLTPIVQITLTEKRQIFNVSFVKFKHPEKATKKLKQSFTLFDIC